MIEKLNFNDLDISNIEELENQVKKQLERAINKENGTYPGTAKEIMA